MKHLTYREWQKSVADAIEAGEFAGMVQCPDCNGSGEDDEVCFHCGADSPKTCETCEGDGRISSSEIGVSVPGIQFIRLDQILPWQDYAKHLEKDLRSLARWKGCPAEELLSSAGFLVWSNIEDRALACRMTLADIVRQEGEQP